MSSPKIVSEKEILRAQNKAKKIAKEKNLDYEEVLKTVKVRERHPVKRIVIFGFGCLSSYFSYLAFMASSLWIGIGLMGLSCLFFYISFFGDRSELSECILKTGENALDILGNVSLDI